MNSFSSLAFIIYSILSFMTLSLQKDVDVTIEEQTFTFEDEETIKFMVTISSPYWFENYKFIEILAKPKTNKALLYLSLNEEDANPNKFDMSAANEGNNHIYVPRTYFEKKNEIDSFYMTSECDGKCDFSISFRLVEKMHAEKSVRLDFLTFDEKEYLIYFDKNLTDNESQLMVTAAGGAKSHHGSKNNVELTLFYDDENVNPNTEINVNSNIMFNGAGTTFLEKHYQKLDKSCYLAKVKAPPNTYISFMVRQFNIISDLPIDGKAIYGFLQENDTDRFELKGFNSNNFGTDNENRTIQVSILVKGELIISKSSDFYCDKHSNTTKIFNVKDESQILLTFTSEELSNNITHICIQTNNEYSKVNAYIIEVHDVTDQKTQTIVTEPLVNGYIYEDKLKLDEVRSYRHSKYITKGSTKYNCKLKQGNIKVALVKCSSFPKCNLTKEKIIPQKPEKSNDVFLLASIDNYYTENVNINLETNAYGPVQYLLAVVCFTKTCTYEVSFSDEEDSLVLREDRRIAHYISQGSSNYYHFKISDFDNVQKVFVYLRTFSGDTNIDVLDDATERKIYYMENTKILEFYDYEFTGLYTLKITGNIGSFYLLSYSILRNNETEENKSRTFGLGISFISGIKNGHKYKNFKMQIDKTRGDKLKYLSNFYPINCDIDVKFQGKQEVKPINGIFQHEYNVTTSIYESNYLEYQVNAKLSNNESSYENKMCLFHVMVQEISSDTESIIGEGTNIGFVLTNETYEIGFIYPHSANHSDILIKYNLETSHLVNMEIKINSSKVESFLLSRSSSHIIPSSALIKFCPDEYQACAINIHFKSNTTIENFLIPMHFIIKSSDITPSYLLKNKLQVDLVTPNIIQYYMVDLNPEDKGEIVINFKKGSGIMFAKIVGKGADPEENSNWNNRVRLPKEGEKEESVGEFNPYKNNIKYDASELYKYGRPVCNNGCELYIGVISTDITNSTKERCDYFEYSIYIRPEMNKESLGNEDKQKLIKKLRVDILANEYITGYINNSSDIHYYFFDVPDDCDSIEIEFQSESCTLYINNGTELPDKLDEAPFILNSKIISMIYNISSEYFGLKSLKGVNFTIAVITKKYDELMSMMYIFRIRMVKSSKNNVIAINGNLASVCEIKNTTKYCDLIYPLSDYEFNIQSNLLIYAETETISEINIYFKPIISYDFDKFTEDELEKVLPRSNNSDKSTETKDIKSYLEIEPEDLKNKKNVKSYALISIKSNKPSIINIYATMRQQVNQTALNPYSKLLFQRKINDIIRFETQGDQSYIFHIRCIEGRANIYFENHFDDKTEIKEQGSQIDIPLKEKKKKNILIIEPTEKFIFYIYENIHPEIRSMELIEFGISGTINYNSENKANFPIIYYMKIYDANNSINLNIHINNLKTTFRHEEGVNYTDIFDITGYMVDESVIKSMMKNKRKNPSKEGKILGKYDKSLTMGKIYFTRTIENKYLVIYFNKNQHMESEIDHMNIRVSAMPFHNELYIPPHDKYIAGNLLKDTKECNCYKLGAADQDHDYIQLEIGLLSSNIDYNITYENKTRYTGSKDFKHGKDIFKIDKGYNNDLTLNFCKKDNANIINEESLNYIFKIKSGNYSNFDNYILENDTVDSNPDNSKNPRSLNLTIPKILSKLTGKAVAADYYIRLYAKSTLDSNYNKLQTISFISYYDYATYIYKIEGEDNDTEPFNYIIKNFPEDQAYIVSIIAVTSDENNEEIFAYQPIVDPFPKEAKVEEKENNTWKIVLLSVGICLGAILLGIAIYFFVRMMKKKKELDDELSKIVGVEIEENDKGIQEDILL